MNYPNSSDLTRLTAQIGKIISFIRLNLTGDNTFFANIFNANTAISVNFVLTIKKEKACRWFSWFNSL